MRKAREAKQNRAVTFAFYKPSYTGTTPMCDLEHLPHKALSGIRSAVFTTVKKPNSGQYEPSTLNLFVNGQVFYNCRRKTTRTKMVSNQKIEKVRQKRSTAENNLSNKKAKAGNLPNFTGIKSATQHLLLL